PERLEIAVWVFHFSVIGAFVGIMQVPLTALLIANEKMGIYAYLSLLDVIMKVGIVFALTYSSYDKLGTYAVMTTIFALIIFFVNHYYCKKNFHEYKVRILFDTNLMKELLGYTGWGFVGSFATILKLQGINIILNMFFGPTVNAARGIAYQVNAAVMGFSQNFTVALNPQIIKKYASGDTAGMVDLTMMGAKFSFYLLFLLGLPILLKTDFLLGIWLVEVPTFTSVFTKLVIMNSLIESFTYAMGASIQATGQIRSYQLAVGGTLILNVPISFLLLKYGFSPTSTLFTSIILAITAILIRVIIINRKVPNFNAMQFIIQVFIISLTVGIISSIIPFIANQIFSSGWNGFIIVTGISVVSTIISIWFIGLTRTERYFFSTRIFCKKGRTDVQNITQKYNIGKSINEKIH
ncbi:MAG: hypothetical protein ACOCQ4_02120, partial [bacterium]